MIRAWVVLTIAACGGRFAPFTSISVGTQPSDIAIADVDGDGRLDLISPNAAGMVLAVVRGAP